MHVESWSFKQKLFKSKTFPNMGGLSSKISKFNESRKDEGARLGYVRYRQTVMIIRDFLLSLVKGIISCKHPSETSHNMR